jgi:hypothetical protein
MNQRPLSYRQLLNALQELSDDQLDMSVTMVDRDGEGIPIYDHILVGELPQRLYNNNDMEDNQPVLTPFEIDSVYIDTRLD